MTKFLVDIIGVIRMTYIMLFETLNLWVGNGCICSVSVSWLHASFYMNTLYSQKLLILITSKTVSDMFIIIHKHKLSISLCVL